MGVVKNAPTKSREWVHLSFLASEQKAIEHFYNVFTDIPVSYRVCSLMRQCEKAGDE